MTRGTASAYNPNSRSIYLLANPVILTTQSTGRKGKGYLLYRHKRSKQRRMTATARDYIPNPNREGTKNTGSRGEGDRKSIHPLARTTDREPHERKRKIKGGIYTPPRGALILKKASRRPHIAHTYTTTIFSCVFFGKIGNQK